MTYSLIYADPPWSYRDKANAGKRGAVHKYPCMSVLDICRLPVPDLAAPNCLLALWWVDTMPAEAMDVCRFWGFRLVKMNGLIWHKTTRHGRPAFGMGHYTRADSESCLFGVRGKASEIIQSRSVRQSFAAPVVRHSEKPQEARDRLINLCGDVPRLEMFARVATPGWDAWGNEVQGIELTGRSA